MSRQVRQMRQLLYPLKRERGESVQIHQIATNDLNITSGAITKTYQTYKVKKAIVLPVSIARTFVYDLAYIAANKNFTGGGLFDKMYTTVIIELSDLPIGIVISLNDYCSISGVTYKVAAVDIFEDAFYILKLTTLTNFASLQV